MTIQNILADSKIRTTLAFYGIANSDHQLASFYSSVVSYFSRIGCVPTNAAIAGAGFGGRIGGFSSRDSQLKKRGFSEVESIEVFAKDDASRREDPDHLADAMISRSARSGTYAAVYAPKVLVDLPVWRKLTLDLIDALRPEYGVEYDRHEAEGPLYFAVGIGYVHSVEDMNVNQTDEEYEASRNRSRWGDMAMPRQLYRQGVVRDVYPRNFLTERHLDRTVEGTSLRQWIANDPARGTLTQASDGIWEWDVAESKIAEVRKPLKELIFDWRDFA